jgi:cytochrome c oxidase subunit 2
MLLSVTVDSEQDFDAWVRGQQERATEDQTVLAGKRIFETTACVNCHAVKGTIANGRYGPDLTHLMSRKTLASGAVANTTDNLRVWIENPEAIKPGSLMPAMKLNGADLDALVRYMETLQ